MFYAYFGGSGKTLNQEVIGKTFVRTILDCGYRIVPEPATSSRSRANKSLKPRSMRLSRGSRIGRPRNRGAKQQMVIAFGLFSMPPGGINKLPNVDYHVWMDQQMNVVANNPVFAGLDGIEWWTSLLADEETVRFVGKLYRHYAIEGKTSMLTRDPLFLNHIQNADFAKGLEGWQLHAAEEEIDSTLLVSPATGRIEGALYGAGARPADPEHIGDTFLWMKRSAKAPNSFAQTIKNLEPGRLYSMEMFSCDYRDLVESKKKSQVGAAQRSLEARAASKESKSTLKRSFAEMYASTPEPTIPIWITDHWKAGSGRKGPTARAGRLRLAGRQRAHRTVRPGADLQFRGDPAVSRVSPDAHSVIRGTAKRPEFPARESGLSDRPPNKSRATLPALTGADVRIIVFLSNRAGRNSLRRRPV